MPYLILGIALLVAAIIGTRAFVGADPKVLAKLVRVFGIAVVAAVVLLLAVTGRFVLALPLIALTMMLLGRWPLRGFGGPGGSRGFFGYGGLGGGTSGPAGGRPPGGAQRSEVSTPWLRMTLEHDSGEMEGEVRQGRHQGMRLSELSLDQLIDLVLACRTDDPQAAALLETYLDRLHGSGWRQKFEAAQAHASSTAGGGRAAAGGQMSAAEAREILGVGPDATPEEIREAHHRLMKKLHPDHGGSTYLASRVNAAKDLLLGD